MMSTKIAIYQLDMLQSYECRMMSISCLYCIKEKLEILKIMSSLRDFVYLFMDDMFVQ